MAQDLQPTLPTYRTVAGVLEREKGTGLELAGWTALRTGLIAVPMILVGVDAKKAFLGGLFASLVISTFTIVRIYNAKHGGMGRLSPKALSVLRQHRARSRGRK